jgi:hypothetical protein
VGAQQVNTHRSDPAESFERGDLFEQACGGWSPHALDIEAVGDTGGKN